MRFSLPLVALLLPAIASVAGKGATEPLPSSRATPAVAGLQLSIQVAKAKFGAEEPVAMEAVIKNGGAAPVDLGDAASDIGSFDITVEYAPEGNAKRIRMPLTRYGIALLQAYDAAKNPRIQMAPGGKRTYRFPLRRMFDLTMAGTYSIRADRTVPGTVRRDQKGTPLPATRSAAPALVSNVLQIEIQESGGPRVISN